MRLPKFDITNRSVQKGLALSVVLLSVVGVYFFTSFLPFFYPPRELKVKELREKVAKLTTEVEQAKRTAANLPRLEKEMEALHVRWEQATLLLPPAKEVAALLRKVTVAGQQAGIEFLVFEPVSPVPQTFYTEHPVTVKVRGGYHDFGVFLSRLANMTRIVNVTELDLKGLADNRDDPRRNKRERDDTVEAAMSITAYSLGAEEVAAAETNAAKPGNEVKKHGPIGVGRAQRPDPEDE